MYGAAVDGPDRPGSRGGDGRRTENGEEYRAVTRFGAGGGRGTGLALLGLVGLVVGGIAFAVAGPTAVEPSSSPDSALGSEAPVASPTSGATVLPDVAILGSPPPTRPVPLDAGWLSWLDPVTGALIASGDPSEDGARLAFADTAGRAVQVCTTTTPVGLGLVTAVDLCVFDSRGDLVSRTAIAALKVVGAVTVGAPILLDATISRDGGWCWLVAAVRSPDAWSVTVYRVDLRDRSVASTREIRRIPVDRTGGGVPSPDGWLVDAYTEIQPVIRASPNDSQLSVTMTAVDLTRRLGLLVKRERVVLDSALDAGSPIDVRFPVWGASDRACDPTRAAWATEQHYLSICSQPLENGYAQPFVRVENPDDMTRDVAVGPSVPAGGLAADRSSWLLDARRGVLFRWSSVGLTLSSLDLATRAGTTVSVDPGMQVGPGGAPWPSTGFPAGPLVWAHLAQADAASPPRLAGSSDGSVLYALGLVRDPGITAPRAVVWAIDPIGLLAFRRWDAPGPVDQLSLAPGGSELIELISPAPPASSSGPISDWTTAAWFVDATAGQPLEVVGRLHGPGLSLPALLPASADTLLGF